MCEERVASTGKSLLGFALVKALVLLLLLLLIGLHYCLVSRGVYFTDDGLQVDYD